MRSGDDRVSSHHLFVILAENRDALLDKLSAHEVGAGVHYVRNDLYPMYEEAYLPHTEFFWRRAISLPMHVDLTGEDVRFVANVIKGGWWMSNTVKRLLILGTRTLSVEIADFVSEIAGLDCGRVCREYGARAMQ